MLLQVPNVLTMEQLTPIRQTLKQASFVDGRLSAGKFAQRVKNNQEVAVDDADLEELSQSVMLPLTQHPMFQNAVLPHHVAMPYFSRYTQGMFYGNHIDDPVMGGGVRYRSDVSVTVFLSDLDEYQGGELVIQTAFGEQQVKCPAGFAVVYPSSSLHHVATVTAGERLVAVTWVQSMIRNPEQRALLYELNSARESLMQVYPDAEVTASVDHSYVNLIRMWAEV